MCQAGAELAELQAEAFQKNPVQWLAAPGEAFLLLEKLPEPLRPLPSGANLLTKKCPSLFPSLPL